MFAQIGYYICVPFAWLTRLFYSLTGSYGLALILFTLVVKLVILPFQLKSKKSMLRMNRMQGKVKDIQTRFANNRERQQQEMAELYAREGVNPMSGCLWSFIPFPILIALYAIIRTPLRYFMSLSTSVIEEIGTLAGTLGYEASNNTYDQIYLAKFIHEHWESFAGKFDGLVDLNYSFLGMDLASQRPVQPVPRRRLARVGHPAAACDLGGGPAGDEHHHHAHQQHRGRRLRQDHDVPDAPDDPVDGLYAARRTVHLLDRQHRVLPDPGGNSQQVLQ